jgi:hypothetical protein
MHMHEGKGEIKRKETRALSISLSLSFEIFTVDIYTEEKAKQVEKVIHFIQHCSAYEYIHTLIMQCSI